MRKASETEFSSEIFLLQSPLKLSISWDIVKSDKGSREDPKRRRCWELCSLWTTNEARVYWFSAIKITNTLRRDATHKLRINHIHWSKEQDPNVRLRTYRSANPNVMFIVTAWAKKNIKVKIIFSLPGRIISSFRFDCLQYGKSRLVIVELNSSTILVFADILI